jgi:hypothetical protein
MPIGKGKNPSIRSTAERLSDFTGDGTEGRRSGSHGHKTEKEHCLGLQTVLTSQLTQGAPVATRYRSICAPDRPSLVFPIPLRLMRQNGHPILAL